MSNRVGLKEQIKRAKQSQLAKLENKHRQRAELNMQQGKKMRFLLEVSEVVSGK